MYWSSVAAAVVVLLRMAAEVAPVVSSMNQIIQ
jgi:hypothetical protein